MKRPKAPKMRRLHDRLVELGHKEFTLSWEPIGPALEMCGHSGGYILESEETDVSIIPLGISLNDAIHNAELWNLANRPGSPDGSPGALLERPGDPAVPPPLDREAEHEAKSVVHGER